MISRLSYKIQVFLRVTKKKAYYELPYEKNILVLQSILYNRYVDHYLRGINFHKEKSLFLRYTTHT